MNEKLLTKTDWRFSRSYDCLIDNSPKHEKEIQNCMKCNRRIRYAHLVVHEELEDSIIVGCECVKKMTGKQVTVKKLIGRANRRVGFLKRKWTTNMKGTHSLKLKKGVRVSVFRDNYGKWKYAFKDDFSSAYPTADAAKLAFFDDHQSEL